MTRSSPERGFGGKTVVITGASSGLGASLAAKMAASGARLALFARSEEKLSAVAERCRDAGAEVLVIAGDATDPRDCEKMVSATVGRFGALDILVVCAGIGMWARFDELQEPAILSRVMDVNYGGLVNSAFYALPHLKASGGMLVAISSVQGKVGVPYHCGYSASKHAVQGFCDALRIELRDSGVDVLTVLAHWIRGTGLREAALGADGTPRGNSSHRHGSGAVPVDEMAGAVIEAIQKRKRAVFVPGWLRLLSALSEIAPAFADRLIARRVDRESAKSPL